MKKKLGIIITIIGIGIIVRGYLEYNKYAKEKNSYALINAKVDAIGLESGVKKAIFIYKVDGKEYKVSMNVYENLEIDSNKEIYYNKNNPEITKFELITPYNSIKILVAGFILFIIGLYLLISILFFNSRKKMLLKKGIKIMAEIQEVLIVPKSNGKNPYKIRATYTNFATNQKYFYESEEDYTDLKELVSRKNINTIPVYIDPKNGSEYYVDIESIK